MGRLNESHHPLGSRRCQPSGTHQRPPHRPQQRNTLVNPFDPGAGAGFTSILPADPDAGVGSTLINPLDPGAATGWSSLFPIDPTARLPTVALALPEGFETRYIQGGTEEDAAQPAYVWRPGRHRNIDAAPQGPLGEDQIVRSGNGIEAGTYIFVRKLDGSVRAMNESLYEEGAFDPEADWPGHTTLADHEPVLFAGGFTVDAEGRALEMTNGSGRLRDRCGRWPRPGCRGWPRRA